MFKLDLELGGFELIQSTSFAEVIQYACANRARSVLYVLSSGSGPMAETKVPRHFVQAFRILPDGKLKPLQEPIPLGNRPLFVTLDRDERHLLIAYNNPSDVTVHRLDTNGAIDDEVLQEPLYYGMTVHQVRVTPHGNIVVVPASAHHVNGVPAGRVDLFDFEDGRLSPRAPIMADRARIGAWRGVKNGALGFSARHVDFHPTRPWMYLVVETQGELHLHDCDETDVALTPRFIESTLSDAPVGRSSQLAGAVHVHPNGRFVYVSNRAWDTLADDPVVDGANTIAIFEIDQSSGEPHLIQQIDTRGIFPRTFGIDDAGQMLAVGNQEPGEIRISGVTRRVVPNLVIFGIGDDGRLTYLQQHDHADNEGVCFWSTVLTLTA